jgi:hypothetical protein
VHPLGPTYISEKGENFGQSIWAKNVVLVGTYWGTHWKLEKPFENKKKKQKNLSLQPRRKENGPSSLYVKPSL